MGFFSIAGQKVFNPSASLCFPSTSRAATLQHANTVSAPHSATEPQRPPAITAASPPRHVAFAPQQTPHAQEDQVYDGGNDINATPYDGVLALLRAGPLSTASPCSFPRPRSISLPFAGCTPCTALRASSTAPSPMPSPLPFELGMQQRQQRQQQVSGVRASRLGPHVGGSTPGAGELRTSLSRTPVHMQPLAPGAGSHGDGARPSGFAATVADGSGLPSSTAPSPLAWTPMRSNMATGPRGPNNADLALSGTKRKGAGSPAANGDAADHISILDAQRRTRQRSEPVHAASCYRSWHAGRTPFHPSLSRLGGAFAAAPGALPIAKPAATSPAILPPVAAPSSSATASGSGDVTKGTTETARRILATLDALDQAAVAGATPGAGTAAACKEPTLAPSPPPTESLGFAGGSNRMTLQFVQLVLTFHLPSCRPSTWRGSQS